MVFFHMGNRHRILFHNSSGLLDTNIVMERMVSPRVLATGVCLPAMGWLC